MRRQRYLQSDAGQNVLRNGTGGFDDVGQRAPIHIFQTHVHCAFLRGVRQ
jgi:hypothetical protein